MFKDLKKIIGSLAGEPQLPLQKSDDDARVYLDYAGATPILPEALRALEDALSRDGNPGAIHREGVKAKEELDRARECIARELGCKAREIVFTSGGTEANNLGILGYFKKVTLSGVRPPDAHWIVSGIEHPSVLACFEHIREAGGKVTIVPPEEDGRVSIARVVKALRPETVFVSIGWANGEIGTVQPLRQISQALRAHEEKNDRVVLLHTDAGQAPLYCAPQVHSLGVDLLTLDSGKLYGPRGIGTLYISNRVELAPIILGGGQERGLRSGTENVALAAGFAKAFEIVSGERKEETERLLNLRNNLAERIRDAIPTAVLNGDLGHVLPNILNISIPGGQNGEYVALALDAKGIAVATKSACREGEGSISHVVAALCDKSATDSWRAEKTMRISLGRQTTPDDLSRFVSVLSDCVR